MKLKNIEVVSLAYNFNSRNKKNKEKVKRFTKFRRLIQEKELFAHK